MPSSMKLAGFAAGLSAFFLGANSDTASCVKLRVMTFNASLNRGVAGGLLSDLSTPDNAQAKKIAEIIQRLAPDVLLINEFDYVEGGKAAKLFRKNYLQKPQAAGVPTIRFPYYYVSPVNTGVDSGEDLNGDGVSHTADDAFGFGLFPGQYGMLVLSKFPILVDEIRTFQKFLWKDMPGNVIPPGYFSEEALSVYRLSSKAHWDVPIQLPLLDPSVQRGKPASVLHALVDHPTPPSFDGPEDRNGRRNHDEIRLWADYIKGTASYWYDDNGVYVDGGIDPKALFVIMGDHNADPLDGGSYDFAINQLLKSGRVRDPFPSSAGGAQAAERQGGANLVHKTDPKYDTGDFGDTDPGNLRIDYVLPVANGRLTVQDAAVWWPTIEDPLFALFGDYPNSPTDHHPVYLDMCIRP